MGSKPTCRSPLQAPKHSEWRIGLSITARVRRAAQ